ncbi:MAG: hypothetical protein LKF42_09520 [Streptococcaceae bacterium]|jgi:very-short-patch-repair endonuclease|nr:hypothetical protein [Streptococcaceae bacterium]MCH4178101.1 hypothetical protein [Streptococcaceae bacterium]
MKKFNLDEIRQFVLNNSNCILLSSEYLNVDTKLLFLCPCGNEFFTTFYKFKNRNKRQCNNCGRKNISKNSSLTLATVKQFIEIDSKSGCKLLSTEYKDAHQKLLIKCKCGNQFFTKFNHFKSSNQRQCKSCGFIILANKRKLDIDYVKHTLNLKNCKLISDYKNSNTKIEIECSCGNHFETLFSLFRDYDVNTCRSCREKNKSRSKGENKIENWLIANNILYKTEFTFKDLKIKKKLRFDFAILNDDLSLKLLIEFDGKQHFGRGCFSSDINKMEKNYKQTIYSDKLKNEYCLKNGIQLLRIPFFEYKNIENILFNNLLNHGNTEVS